MPKFVVQIVAEFLNNSSRLVFIETRTCATFRSETHRLGLKMSESNFFAILRLGKTYAL